MNINTKYLSKAKAEQILVDLYTDHYNESDFGFILDYNDDFLLLEKFKDNSTYDGISVFIRSNITRMRWGGNEIESVSKLLDSSQRLKPAPAIDLTTIESALHAINKFFGHVTVHIQDIDSSVCFIGQVHDTDSGSIVIHEFGSSSTLDRKYILLHLADITRIDAGGQYERQLETLILG